MTIREFRETDTHSLRQVYFDTRQHAFSWENDGSITLGDFDKNTEGEKIWVYELSNKVIGFVSVWEPEDFIHHLFVLPEYSRHGYGSQLLETCMANIGRPASLKCVSQNKNALAFYQSKGWLTISTGISSDIEYQLMQTNEI